MTCDPGACARPPAAGHGSRTSFWSGTGGERFSRRCSLRLFASFLRFLKLLQHFLGRLCHLLHLLSARLSLCLCGLISLFQGSILGLYLRDRSLRLFSLKSHAWSFRRT